MYDITYECTSNRMCEKPLKNVIKTWNQSQFSVFTLAQPELKLKTERPDN